MGGEAGTKAGVQAQSGLVLGFANMVGADQAMRLALELRRVIDA